MKRMGPSTEPWGTPCETGAVLDMDLLMLMNWQQSERYDLNQEMAVPVTPREDSRQERMMDWFIVLKGRSEVE